MKPLDIKTNIVKGLGTITKIEKKVGDKIMRYAQMKLNGVLTEIYVGTN